MSKIKTKFASAFLSSLLFYTSSLLAISFHVHSQGRDSSYQFTDGSIVDEKVFQLLDSASHKLMEAGETETFAKLAAQLGSSSCSVELKARKTKVLSDLEIHKSCKSGVLVVATIYKCPHCPNNHIRAASGFAIAEDGIAVTSYHIFRGDATDENTDLTVVVMDIEGNMYPAKAVLAANQTDDIAIFSFDTKGKKLAVLPLGEDAEPGSEVKLISHPHNMFYSFSQGIVSRNYIRNNSKKTSITAEFSQGSSGAPVLDNKGNVISVVSATLSLYNGDNHLQMVSRETVPVSRILALIKK